MDKLASLAYGPLLCTQFAQYHALLWCESAFCWPRLERMQDGHNVGLSQSYAKNMGLYGQRIGCLSIVCDNPQEAVAVESQLKAIARPTYSNPPLHGTVPLATMRLGTALERESYGAMLLTCSHALLTGAAIVTKVLGDPVLKQQWYGEVKEMADRIIDMRKALRSALEAAGAPGTWNHVTDQIGMFCFSGMTGEQVSYLS